MNEIEGTIRIIPIPLNCEIRAGVSIAQELLKCLRHFEVSIQKGDILVVKHKIVSKAENQVVALSAIQPSADSLAWAKEYGLDGRVVELAMRESSSVIRRKNGVLITETRHGFICANSGVDVSNVDGGAHAILLPKDADRSAAKIRRQIQKRTGILVPVIIADSFGRPWREGLTEAAIGLAGMQPLRDDRGHSDPHGYRLRVSIEAIADELACAAGLACGKLNRTPACIIRGFAYPAGRGSSRDLIRPTTNDLFR